MECQDEEQKEEEDAELSQLIIEEEPTIARLTENSQILKFANKVFPEQDEQNESCIEMLRAGHEFTFQDASDEQILVKDHHQEAEEEDLLNVSVTPTLSRDLNFQILKVQCQFQR